MEDHLSPPGDRCRYPPMKTSTNICGGTTYSLENGDRLESLPTDFAGCITSEIVAAFNSPIEFFRNIARTTQCAAFAKFLNHCTEFNKWSLDVSETFLPHRDFSVDFRLITESGREYFLHPGKTIVRNNEFSEIHQYIARINWGGIGCAGEFFSGDNQPTLEQYCFESKNPTFPPASTIVFANSPCGDAMIYNEHGNAGYITHESYGSYEFGSLSTMIDWIFDSLSKDRWPEFEWERLPNGG